MYINDFLWNITIKIINKCFTLNEKWVLQMYLVLNIEYTTMKYLGKKLTSICFEIDYFIIIVFEATCHHDWRHEQSGISYDMWSLIFWPGSFSFKFITFENTWGMEKDLHRILYVTGFLTNLKSWCIFLLIFI